MNLTAKIRARIERQATTANGYITEVTGYVIRSTSTWSDTWTGPQREVTSYLKKPEARARAWWGLDDVLVFPTIAAARAEFAKIAAQGVYMKSLRIVPRRSVVACDLSVAEDFKTRQAAAAARMAERFAQAMGY